MSKFRTYIALLLFGLFVSPVLGKEKRGTSEWELQPEKTVNTIVNNEKGEIVSSDVAMSGSQFWTFIYLKTSTDYFKCVDYSVDDAKVKGNFLNLVQI